VLSCFSKQWCIVNWSIFWLGLIGDPIRLSLLGICHFLR
jgi:hypothetical protein